MSASLVEGASGIEKATGLQRIEEARGLFWLIVARVPESNTYGPFWLVVSRVSLLVGRTHLREIVDDDSPWLTGCFIPIGGCILVVAHSVLRLHTPSGQTCAAAHEVPQWLQYTVLAMIH